MEDWSTLPEDLIHLISKRLPTSTDLLLFRSVCPTWRSAAQLPPAFSPRLPKSFPCPKGWNFQLLKCTTYCLQSQLPDHSPWIVKLYRQNPTRMHLIDPLTRFQFKPLPNNFPKCLNTLNFRVKELCEEYTLRYEKAGDIRLKRVAVLNKLGAGYVLLTVHMNGKLLVCDEDCRVVEDPLFSQYDDLIVREGRFYAVDMNGRLLFVNHEDLNVSVVADAFSGGNTKFLVNSNGELLLVDLYWGQAGGMRMWDKIVKFKVFRLDENVEKWVEKWVEVNDLGDRILFVGNNFMLSGESCNFSASASEIFHKDDPCNRGNCIVFDDRYDIFEEDGEPKGMSLGVGVFHLESGIIKWPIHSHVCYSKMLSPPPDWVCSSASVGVRVDGNSDTTL